MQGVSHNTMAVPAGMSKHFHVESRAELLLLHSLMGETPVQGRLPSELEQDHERQRMPLGSNAIHKSIDIFHRLYTRGHREQYDHNPKGQGSNGPESCLPTSPGCHGAGREQGQEIRRSSHIEAPHIVSRR